MTIIKKDPKKKTVCSKITDSQDEKLIRLAEKHGITKSNLLSQLIEIGFKEASGNKTF